MMCSVILATGYAQDLAGLASTLPRLFKPYTQLQLLEAVTQALAKPPAQGRLG